MATGYECGIGLLNFNDIKIGDIIEVSIQEEIKSFVIYIEKQVDMVRHQRIDRISEEIKRK